MRRRHKDPYRSAADWSFKQKLAFTLGILFIYRVGVMIPLPFVNSDVFTNALAQSEIAGSLLSAATMVGGSLTQMGVFSLGVMPFITSSIVFQLLKLASPQLKELGETDAGKKQITQWTRYLTLLFASIQAVGIVIGAPSLLGVDVFGSAGLYPKIVAVLVMVAGSIIIMRFGEEITLKGIGNGTSLVIFTSILASIPALITQASIAKSWFGIILFLAILLGILAVVSYVEKSEYRVTVLYTKTSIRSNPSATHLPIKVAIAGVLPVILASALLSVPKLIGSFTNWAWLQWIDINWPHGSVPYSLIFMLLIVGMTFFSVPMTFDAGMIAKSLKNQGGFVDGKTPGKGTEKYLSWIAQHMAGLDAVYLIAIGMASLYLFPLAGVPEGAFGATSIIILATVVVTLLGTIQSEISSKKAIKSSFLI